MTFRVGDIVRWVPRDGARFNYVILRSKIKTDSRDEASHIERFSLCDQVVMIVLSVTGCILCAASFLVIELFVPGRGRRFVWISQYGEDSSTSEACVLTKVAF